MTARTRAGGGLAEGCLKAVHLIDADEGDDHRGDGEQVVHGRIRFQDLPGLDQGVDRGVDPAREAGVVAVSVLAVGAQELTDLVAADHHRPVVGISERVLAPQEDQHERGVSGQGLLAAQHARDVVTVLLPLERDLSLTVEDQVKVHLIQAGTQVALVGHDPFPRGAMPGPGDVAVHQQGHQGTPGRLGEPVIGQVVPMLVLNVGVVGEPGVVVGAWPRTAHYFTPARIAMGS